jgi:16S rRNA (cytosine1402-N4)-methyltransferase
MAGFEHQAVMLVEVVAALQPRAGGCYVDGTLGGGSHAAALLEASRPDGRLFGCDQDPAALAAATERLAEFAGRTELRLGRFEQLDGWLAAGSCDGVVLDLGVSSHQLNTAERGFSFQQDGPLDMRMSGAGSTAADLVNELPVDELARLFEELGDERHARRIARAIGEQRARGRILSTGQLASLIERVIPRRGAPVHPATRVFQALRMATNDELGTLDRGLAAAWRVLKRGGRLACLTFHSGEARRVKQFGQALARDYEVPEGVDRPELRRPRPAGLRWVTRRPAVPGEAEVAVNPRARSAQLRVMEKLTD